MALSEPTNNERAQWAKNALTVFTDETYNGDHPDTMDPGDLESAIQDLISDLMHLASRKGISATGLHARALTMFEAEVWEETTG